MKRLFGLDLVRALAIILVLLSHSRNLLISFYPGLDFLKAGGFFGVELFFVLSGFLIGGILIKDIQAGFDFGILKNFWKRRWLRTLPNYYLFLIINFLAVSFFTRQLFVDARYFAFIQNLWYPHPGFFGEAWSLAVEEWFYLIFPLILLATLKLKPTKERLKRLLNVAIISILTIIVARFFYVLFTHPDWDEGIRKIVFCRLDSIMYGVICSYIYVKFPAAWNKAKWPLLPIGASLLTISVILFYHLDSTQNSIFMGTLYFTLTSIAVSLLMPFFTSISCGLKKLASAVTTTSMISYSIYLIHNSILLVTFKVLFKPANQYQALIFWCAYILATFVSSFLVYRYFEKPMLALRDKKLKFRLPILHQKKSTV